MVHPQNVSTMFMESSKQIHESLGGYTILAKEFVLEEMISLLITTLRLISINETKDNHNKRHYFPVRPLPSRFLIRLLR